MQVAEGHVGEAVEDRRVDLFGAADQLERPLRLAPGAAADEGVGHDQRPRAARRGVADRGQPALDHRLVGGRPVVAGEVAGEERVEEG